MSPFKLRYDLEALSLLKQTDTYQFFEEKKINRRMNKKFDIIRSGIKLARHITFKASCMSAYQRSKRY